MELHPDVLVEKDSAFAQFRLYLDHQIGGSILLIHLLLVLDLYPLDPLAIFPDALLDLTGGGGVGSCAMLLAIEPIAIVPSPILPVEHPVPLFFIVVVVASVLATVGPGEGSVALHLVIVPLSDEVTSIAPSVATLSLNIIILEISIIGAAI